jgi:tetratricopeptide (TPR) repeat protein
VAQGGVGGRDAAEATLTEAVRLNPRHADARWELARLFAASERHAEAEASYRALLRLVPRSTKAACDFGAYLMGRGRPKEALAQAEAALAFEPDSAAALNLRAGALVALGRMDDAVAGFRRAAAADRSDPGALSNLGTALATEGRFDDALAALDAAVRLAPDDPVVRLNRAIALLKAGWLIEGWAEWEWRHRQPGRERLPPALMLPPLAEHGDIAGRTVFVHHEEGFGDTIQFYRYLSLLAQEGARVLLWAPQPLARLLGSQPERLEIVTDTMRLPPFDYHCPINSLPHVFGTTIESVPGKAPYLCADQGLMRHWADRLPAGACRVGLVWAGEPRPHDPAAQALDRRRSLALHRLESLLDVESAVFVSLQKGAAARQVFAPVHDPMTEVTDFADTAAIIANLDLVISVDTAVAHLAAAMGKPVFLLDRYDNCWRWLAARTDSPWYPTLQIFRQPRMGDWAPAIRAATEALKAFIAESRTHG